MSKRKETNFIVCHTTATPLDTTVESIRNYWKTYLGWSQVGYAYMIKADGTFEQLADDLTITNGVKGFNYCSLHIATIGGIDDEGNPVDNRTDAQKLTQFKLIKALMEDFPTASLIGHNEFHNVTKTCPNYHPLSWYNGYLATYKK